MALHDQLQENVPLAPFTTIGLGGPARYFIVVTSVELLRDALQWAKEKELGVHILGGGSNTIFTDEGFDGLVIRMQLKGMDFTDDGLATAAAGEEWDPFVLECVERNLAGVECLSGIPGHVGGTPIQNVGAYGQEVAQTIVEVRVLDVQTLEEKSFTNAECGFAYRWSRFKGGDAGHFIITGVVFQLKPDGAPSLVYEQLRLEMESAVGQIPTLQQVRETVLRQRKSKSMVVDPADPDTKSCGSFFQNVEIPREDFSGVQEAARRAGITEDIPVFEKGNMIRIPSAWLIGHAGFPKGFVRGGVGISSHHNLALINTGIGTTAELLQLAADIEAAVRKMFGLQLQREPVLVR